MGAPCSCYWWVRVLVCSSIVLTFCPSVKHVCSSSCIHIFAFQRRLKDAPASVLVHRDRGVCRELPTTASVDTAQGQGLQKGLGCGGIWGQNWKPGHYRSKEDQWDSQYRSDNSLLFLSTAANHSWLSMGPAHNRSCYPSPPLTKLKDLELCYNRSNHSETNLALFLSNSPLFLSKPHKHEISRACFLVLLVGFEIHCLL